MFKWVESIFKKKPNRFIGLFKNWKYDKFYFESQDKKYSWWICNGFSFFKDRVERRYGYENCVIFLDKLTEKTRHEIWIAVKEEIKSRIIKRNRVNIEEFLKEIKG